FMLFSRLYGFYRKKLPFGVAQLGRVYRNEISPRQGVIRLREFSQAEVELFVNPKEKTHKDFRKCANEELRLVLGEGGEITLSAREAVGKNIIAHELLAYHLVLVKKFLEEVGIPREKLRFRQHMKTEMAHYAMDCWDAEVATERFGYIEVVGIADRTDYDLKAHMKHSGADLSAFLQFEEPREIEKKIVEANLAKLGSKFKEKTSEIVRMIKNLGEKEIAFFEKKEYIDLKIDGENIRLDKSYLTAKKVKERVTGEKIIPHVIEPSYGIDRIVYCVLESAYRENGERKILSLKNSVTPIEAAVFPLIAKEELTAPALEIYENLKNQNFFCIYDEADSIGRRYARVDEIGVPYAITIDFDGLKDGTVTIRERDTTEQRRIKIKEIQEILKDLLEEKVGFKEL
ncbi:MAG: glycine--tRNA ligase, partial [Euryarchaeota archaeon]|nr:glycine--tRNA ligase [Euryarchaeota archaeon]